MDSDSASQRDSTDSAGQASATQASAGQASAAPAAELPNGQSESVLRQPPAAGSETDTLLGTLERLRGYIAWKCGNLDAAGLRATLPPSTMTLGGLVKHLALVEDEYFTRWVGGQQMGPPWNAVDWDADPDWEWRTAATDTPGELYALWEAAVARSRAEVEAALARDGLDQLTGLAWPDGRTASLRRILTDMIEEYARHVGHADLIRESVDGLTGEDPE